MAPVAALAAGAALALSGCGAGQVSQTANQVPAINGNHAEIGRIALRNVHIVYPGAGAGPEYNNAKGGKALIALSIINNSETVTDELISVKTDLGDVKLTAPAGKSGVVIEPQHTVVAAAKAGGHAAPAAAATSAPAGAPTTSPAAPATGHGASPTAARPAGEKAEDPAANPAMIEISGLTRDIGPGLTYTVTFNFKQNGTVGVQVPVDAGPLTERQGDTSDKAAEGEHKGGH
ncbi:hypothetical protein D5S18_25300 [Nocardia panacis]|uniref:Copper chaperone PCu(A)C n=2 Tax=Nocardia panacis TaxID=2340916 RepID=A0A3A4KCD0_9NOCA|nr:hypothetical protein D5S18_25300 [Nocardia panacis]